jgi:hypothetical protein
LPHPKEIRSQLKSFRPTAKWTPMEATHLRKFICCSQAFKQI